MMVHIPLVVALLQKIREQQAKKEDPDLGISQLRVSPQAATTQPVPGTSVQANLPVPLQPVVVAPAAPPPQAGATEQEIVTIDLVTPTNSGNTDQAAEDENDILLSEEEREKDVEGNRRERRTWRATSIKVMEVTLPRIWTAWLVLPVVPASLILRTKKPIPLLLLENHLALVRRITKKTSLQ